MLQNLYPHLIAFHSILRWIVLLAAVVAIFSALSGWSAQQPAISTLMRASILFVIVIDIEFLTGLVLYFGASPITREALANPWSSNIEGKGRLRLPTRCWLSTH
jgi:hypothetical protein